MKPINSRRLLLTAGLLLTLALAGCGPALGGNPDTGPAVSALTEDQVTEIAANALQAYNTGDYAAWSRDWSSTMKSAIKESDFEAFRQQSLPVTGNFKAITGVESSPAQTPGYVRWLVKAEFEKTPVELSLVFPDDGTQIEGINFLPTG